MNMSESENVNMISCPTDFVIGDAPPLKTSRRGSQYPDPQTSFGKAWTYLWTMMKASYPQYLDGVTMTQQMVDEKGYVQRATMDVFLSKAAKSGLLERDLHMVVGSRGPRRRATYRIAPRYVNRGAP